MEVFLQKLNVICPFMISTSTSYQAILKALLIFQVPCREKQCGFVLRFPSLSLTIEPLAFVVAA